MNTTTEAIAQNNKIIAEFMGWKYFKESKAGIEGYPFGGHDGFEITDIWVLNPTEKYKENPCHFHYEYMNGNFDDSIKKSDLFEDYAHSLKFHSDWNWLMEVVEKIESLDYFFNSAPFIDDETDKLSGEHFCIIQHRTTQLNMPYFIDVTGCSSKKEATYKAVVEFIQWYNTQAQN